MSDSYSVVYSPEAMDDIREIYSYIAFTLLVPETAEKQVNRIREEIRLGRYLCVLVIIVVRHGVHIVDQTDSQ